MSFTFARDIEEGLREAARVAVQVLNKAHDSKAALAAEGDGKPTISTLCLYFKYFTQHRLYVEIVRCRRVA